MSKICRLNKFLLRSMGSKIYQIELNFISSFMIIEPLVCEIPCKGLEDAINSFMNSCAKTFKIELINAYEKPENKHCILALFNNRKVEVMFKEI